MDDFECKAPMYFNFSETSALHENDGADKFFGKLMVPFGFMVINFSYGITLFI